jgi:5-methylcytosine-specific restriction endonuclease McrA
LGVALATQESTKTCSTCRAEKLLEDFNKYKSSKDGRQPRCRECQSSKRIAWYAANREREIEKSKQWNRDNAERYAANSARWREENRERYLKTRRVRYKKHAQGIVARKMELRAANPDKFRAHEKAWRAANPDKIRAKHVRELQGNPRLSHERYWRDPEFARAKSARRKAMRRAVTVGVITPESLKARIAYYGGKCWMCGADYEHLDHVKPISKGGAHMLANIRPACAPCNLLKSNQWPYKVPA